MIVCAAAVCLLVVAFVLSPLGKSATDAVRLIRSESGEIAEFFSGKTYSTNESEHVRTLDGDNPSVPAVDCAAHTEVIPTPYNSAEKKRTVASVGETELFAQGEDRLTDEEKRGYTAIPVFIDRNVSSVASILSAHGIVTNTVTRTNTAPAGEVFAIRYAGRSDEGGYYINPSVAVTLYVSAPKKATVQADGNNIVYLTFDDGPSAAHTEEILDILDTYGIKGTFFTIGTAVEKYPDIVRSVVDRGHLLGCHTMTHVYSEIYESVRSLEDEMDMWEKTVKDAGVKLTENEKFFRFPGGSVGTYLDAYKVGQMTGMLAERGYRAYDWNVSTNDAVLFLAPEDENSYDYIKRSYIESLETCLKQNENKTDAPIIVLMHESANETPELLTWLIEYMTERGFSFGNLGNVGSWTFSQPIE